MNTYVLMAPDYARVEIVCEDVRYYYARDLAHAQQQAVWQCDPDDIVCLVAFRGQCDALNIPTL